MKLMNLYVAGILLAALAGCHSASSDANTDAVSPDQTVAADVWLAEEVRSMSVSNAVISQHTLYPYHFVQNSADLNGLGKRDLGILAAHFKAHPGLLNIRRGNVSDAMYSSRVQTASRYLVEAGVDKTRIVFSDGLPGGEGVGSERMHKIVEDSYKKPSGASGYSATAPMIK